MGPKWAYSIDYRPCIPSASAFLSLAFRLAASASIFLLLPRCTLRVLLPSRQEIRSCQSKADAAHVCLPPDKLDKASKTKTPRA